MPTEIQNKEIRGLTAKVILTGFISMVSCITAVEVNYFNMVAKNNEIKYELESQKLINKMMMDAVKRDIFNLGADQKEIQNRQNTLMNEIEKYHFKR